MPRRSRRQTAAPAPSAGEPRASTHRRSAPARRGESGRGAWLLILAGILVLAWGWRVAYLGRLAQSPLAGTLIEDSNTYWEWARYLVRSGPLGHHPFFLGPLYPYALALLRAVLGDSIGGVLQVQALWGAAAAALLADAARRLARPAIGVVVGLLVAFYRMAVFFDGLILMESLLFFLESVLLWWVVVGGWVPPRRIALAGVGLLVGLLAEGRATAALLLAPAALTLVPWSRASWRAGLGSVLALGAGFALVVAPVAIRNAAVSGEWIPFTYNFGYNLYVGNHPEATGGFSLITGTHQVRAGSGVAADGGSELDGREYLAKVEGVDLGPGASSRYWAAKARRYAAEHPGRVARLALSKLGMLWNRREYAQIENADEFHAMAGPLGLPFAPLGALALTGLWFAWRRGPAGRFLLGYATVMTLVIAPFFVTDRYRHHLVPATALLAAVAIAEIVERARRGSWAARGRIGAALLAGWIVVQLPAPALSAGKYQWGLAVDLGTRWLEHGRPDRAVWEFEKALALESGGAFRGAATPTAAAERAALYHRYASALERTGRRAEALAWRERAVAEAPDNAVMVQALADAYRAAGRGADAEALDARLPALVGGEARARLSRGRQAARAGRLEEAERQFAEAVAGDPGLFDAWGALIRVRVQRHEIGEARSALEQARAAGFPHDALRAHEALIAAVLGDSAAARRALAEVPAAALIADPSLADVVRVTRGLLDRAR